MESLRARLLARLESSQPRLVKLVAPAGYGKTTVARAFAERFTAGAVVDCARARGPLDFAMRTLGALAEEQPERATEIAEARMRLHASMVDDSAFLESLSEAWAARSGRSFFVFENVESIVDSPAHLEILHTLLLTSSDQRVIGLCSRSTIPLRFSKYFAPHQILTLGVRDLRFTPEDSARAFTGIELDPAVLAKAVSTANGWPIAVLLLARLAREQSLGALLEDMHDVAYVDIHDYLSEQVLSSLAEASRAMLFAVAAIPEARSDDIARATGIETPDAGLLELSDLPGMVTCDTHGRYTLHPMMHATLRARHQDELGGVLRAAANAHRDNFDFLRAAELYAVDEDFGAAASALAQIDLRDASHESARLAAILSAIPASIAGRHANLWIAAIEYRGLRPGSERAHYDGVKRMLATLPLDAAPELRARVALRLGFLAYAIGEYAEAESVLDAIGDFPDDGEDAPSWRKFLLAGRAATVAARGRLDEAETLWKSAKTVASSISFDALHYESRMWGARNLGDWDTSLRLAIANLTMARRSANTLNICYALVRYVTSTWLVCDDETALVTAKELAEEVAPIDAVYAEYLRTVAVGRIPEACDELGFTIPMWSALLLARRCHDRHVYLHFAEDLLNRCNGAVQPYFEILLRVVCACVPGSDAVRHVREAQRALERWESAPLREALAKLERNPNGDDFGVLTTIVSQTRAAWSSPEDDFVTVDVLLAQVRRGGDVLQLSGRGLELMMALSLLGDTATNERIADALWPQFDAVSALNALKTTVHRLRSQLGSKDVVLSTKAGYRLSPDVRVDLRDIEQLIRSAPAQGTLPEVLRFRLSSIVEFFSAASFPFADSWEWFAPFEARIARVRYEAALLLANDAFARGDTPVVFELSERLLEMDRCDESAYELKIRTMIQTGNRAAAMREYRRYRDILKSELNVEPSLSLTNLLAVAG